MYAFIITSISIHENIFCNPEKKREYFFFPNSFYHAELSTKILKFNKHENKPEEVAIIEYHVI